VATDASAKLEARVAGILNRLKKQGRLAHAAEQKFFTVDEVAAQTDLSKWTMRNACKQGPDQDRHESGRQMANQP
jgi:hypothetical protein